MNQCEEDNIESWVVRRGGLGGGRCEELMCSRVQVLSLGIGDRGGVEFGNLIRKLICVLAGSARIMGEDYRRSLKKFIQIADL